MKPKVNKKTLGIVGIALATVLAIKNRKKIKEKAGDTYDKKILKNFLYNRGHIARIPPAQLPNGGVIFVSSRVPHMHILRCDKKLCDKYALCGYRAILLGQSASCWLAIRGNYYYERQQSEDFVLRLRH